MEHSLLEYLANSLWQLPLLAGGTWLSLRIVRPGLRIQHAVWLTVLALIVTLPLYNVGRSRAGMRASAIPPQVPAIQASGDEFLKRDTPPTPTPLAWFTHPGRSVPLSKRAARSLVALYMTTTALALVRFVRAWRATQRLVADAREIVLPQQVMAMLEGCARRYSARLPHLRESGEIASPAVVGIHTPVLLLPERFAERPHNEIKSALFHELAHVRRRDYLVNLLCRFVALPLAWHPVTYAVERRVSRTRELICDEAAAQEMMSKTEYARCLASLAHGMVREYSAAGGTAALSLFDNNVLEERIMWLTENKGVTNAWTAAARAAGGVAVTIAAAAMAMMFHLTPTMAESQTIIQPETAQKTASSSPGDKIAAGRDSVAADKAAAAAGKAHHAQRESTPMDQAQIDRQMSEVQRQVAEATAKFNSPAFKKQLDDAIQQELKAASVLRDHDIQAAMAKAQQQVADATAKINSPAFKKQLDDAIQQQLKAESVLRDHDIQAAMADAQRQVADALAKLKTQLKDVPDTPK